MSTPAAKAAYNQRKGLIEPMFGILKEQMGIRRFLLRGLANVRSEAGLVATALNLRTLYRVWQTWSFTKRTRLTCFRQSFAMASCFIT